MARVVGVDPGTRSMDLLGFDDETMEVFLDEAIDRDLVTRDPRIVIETIRRAEERVGGIDAIVAPSGYGVPLKRAQEASLEEIALATFVTPSDVARRLRIIGLRELMILFKESDLPAWFTPGAIHLPTIPSWRKLNRIDMGTADKIYTVAAALRHEVESLGVSPGEARFIVVESGFAYTAALSVVGGAVVDGVGGTSGFPGFLGGGSMDSELAYALAYVEPGFSKARLFEGGAGHLAGVDSLEALEECYAASSGPCVDAVRVLSESIVKDVAALLATNTRPQRIYLSGRVFRYPKIAGLIIEALEGFLSEIGVKAELLRIPRLGAKTKEAATGAALIASGLAGGRYSWLVDSLRLRESSGSIFDYIAIKGVREKLRDSFSKLI